MTFLFRFEIVVILGIHTYLNMGARPWIYVAQIYNRLDMPRDLNSDVLILGETLSTPNASAGFAHMTTVVSAFHESERDDSERYVSHHGCKNPAPSGLRTEQQEYDAVDKA